MTMYDCPRCHGLRFSDETGRFEKGRQEKTLRIVNVMATTERIHFECGNCGFKETRPYNWEQVEKEHKLKDVQKTLV